MVKRPETQPKIDPTPQLKSLKANKLFSFDFLKPHKFRPGSLREDRGYKNHCQFM